jgi:hypothetical protein
LEVPVRIPMIDSDGNFRVRNMTTLRNASHQIALVMESASLHPDPATLSSYHPRHSVAMRA